MGARVPEREPASAAELEHGAEAVFYSGATVAAGAKRFVLQGALHVAILAVTTVDVMGFLSLVVARWQAPEPTLASAKEPSWACMPSRCRAKAETGRRDNRR